MRILFTFIIIICAGLFYLNGIYLPDRQSAVKEAVDNHIKSFETSNANEITYYAKLRLYPLELAVYDLRIDSGISVWVEMEFHNAFMDIERISYNASQALLKGNVEVESIGNIKYQAVISYGELAKRFDSINDSFFDVTVLFDDGKTFMRGYFTPLQDKLEFDGSFILTMDGKLEYKTGRIFTDEGFEQRSEQVKEMINDALDMYIVIRVLDREISLNDIEILNNGIWISGEYNGDKI